MTFRTASLCLLSALAMASGLGVPARAQSNATITNTAQLTFSAGAVVQTLQSNTVSVTVTSAAKPTITLLRLAYGSPGSIVDASASQCQTAAGWTPVVSTSLETFDPASAKLADAPNYEPGDPVFIKVVSPDSDIDPTVRGSVTVNIQSQAGDKEAVKLRETGPNTGVFIGFINSDADAAPTVSNCSLSLFRGGAITVWFEDAMNGVQPISDTALVDPFGFVFSTSSSQGVSGAKITLIDDATGKAAAVYGTDGVSAYPSTVTSGETVTDGAGKVYVNLPGEFRFPQTKSGRYHLQVVAPGGYSAPSTVPLSTLQTLITPIGTPFVLGPASFGASFDLKQGADLQIDVPIDPQKGTLAIEKSASVTDASFGDLVQYRITVRNPGSAGAVGAAIADVLPKGFRYVAGSAKRDGVKISDPSVSGDGRNLSFALGALTPGASTEVRYVTRLGAEVTTGDAVNRATAAQAGGVASNVAEAVIHVHAPFFTDAGSIIGRVLEGACDAKPLGRVGVANVRILLEDGTFVVSDKDGRFHFEGVRTGLHVAQMDYDTLPKGLVAQSCGRDTRNAGRAFSRFVDMQGGMLWRIDFHLRRTAMALPTRVKAKSTGDEDDGAAVGGEGRDWLDGQKAGPPAFLFPGVDHNPRAPSVRVVVKHAPNEAVELLVNGQAVDPLLLDSDNKSADGQVFAIMWRGVPIKEGDNTLTAVISVHKREVARLTRIVHYANTPAKAEALPSRSRLIADGIVRPLIAVRITDRFGKPVRQGAMGTFTVGAPYKSFAAIEADQKRQLSGLDGAAPTWRVVGDEGVAMIELAPTSQAGAVKISLPMPGDAEGHPTEVSAWLSADREKWIVAGFAAGSLGFNTLSRHVDPLARDDGKLDFADGQVAFFAKGRIKGAWLLTMAYDNRKTVDRDRGLFGAIDPDRYYTVYGDGAAQAYDAATQRKLYLRLERKEFYALFGDFQTGFDQTELGRYTRVLNGFKFERQGKVINITGFAADTDQLSIRDEIQGQGIAGPYRLSQHDIVPNGEQLTIETRDRARSDHVLNTLTLTRNVDYQIDYQTGTVTFASPVMASDANLNPNIIVAQYEVEGGGAKAIQAGLRASVTLMNGKLKAGATYLHDGQKLDTSSGDVIATDVSLQIRPDTKVKLEAAVSDPNAATERLQTAYLAEVEHKSANLEALAYFRQEDLNFGLNQQSGAELGAQKYGIDGKLHLAQGLSLTATGYHETYMTTGATRDVLDARLDYNFFDWRLNVGVKLVEDSTAALSDANSTLLTFGASHDFFDHKLQLTGSRDFSLDGEAKSADFPVRHRVGVSYALTKDVRLVASEEIAEGAGYTTDTTRIGAEVQPWKGAKLTSGLDEQGLDEPAITENGERTFAELGMTQTITISKTWTVDAAVDSSSTIAGKAPTAQQVNPDQPLGSGGATYTTVSQTGAPAGVVAEDFKSVSLGVTYRAATWSWNARVEARLATSADTWSVRSGWLHQIGDGFVAAINIRSSQTQAYDGALSATSQIDGSVAWRPLNSRWSVLEKLTLKDEEATGTAADQTLAGFGALAATDGASRRVVNNIALNYDTAGEGQEGRGQWQVSAYYGAKFVDGAFDGDQYTGFVDVMGLVGRYDLSSRVDIGLSAAVQHAWSDHNIGFSFGPSVGLSPATNTWVSVGWNLVGFRDRDFEQSNYTRQGPYVTFRLKFDQMSLAPLIHRVQGARP